MGWSKVEQNWNKLEHRQNMIVKTAGTELE